MRQTKMYVSTKIFFNNIQKIQDYIGNKEIMPVVKANAYGTYINKKIEVLNKFNIVAVAIVDEAIELRNLGFEKDILVLNQPFIEELDDIEKYNLIIGLSEKSFLEKVISSSKKIRAHLEIETGMNRTGVNLSELQDFIDKIKTCQNIEIEGVYTHFSSADFDSEYTNMQIEKFKNAVQIVRNNFDKIKYIHSSASNGILNFDDGVSNAVRPGILMYGFKPYDYTNIKIDVKPICKLKSKISFIKSVDEGESISYSRKFIAPQSMKIATVAIGYADGLRRSLSNNGYLVVKGTRCAILGSVCMDSCMIDITNIEDAKVEDDVYIWDNETQTLDDLANYCGTINYEIMSTISDRVIRVFEE